MKQQALPYVPHPERQHRRLFQRGYEGHDTARPHTHLYKACYFIYSFYV